MWNEHFGIGVVEFLAAGYNNYAQDAISMAVPVCLLYPPGAVFSRVFAVESKQIVQI